eukprot:g1206.t1
MFNVSYKDMGGDGASQTATTSISVEEKARQGASHDQTSAAEKQHQQAKYDELIEVLVSAGYFRARIDGLSPFDKIVGGLCWCIETSGEGVDVDILFQENSKIGQRIRLSERIVEAVRQMNCPFPLQAHQIQGSDFAACHPVIIWLVKKFIETREATKAMLRHHSSMVFGKGYELPDEAERKEPSKDYLADISSRYRAERRFRKDKHDDTDEEEVRVQSCLFEYGERVGAAAGEDGTGEGGDADNSGLAAAAKAAREAAGGTAAGPDAGLSAFERKFLAAQQQAARDDEAQRLADAAREEQLIAEMAAVEGGFASLASASNVGSLMGMQDVSAAAAAYEAEQEKLKRMLEEMDEGGAEQRAEMQAHKRKRAALQRQIAEAQARGEGTAAEAEAVAQRLRALREEVQKTVAYNARIVREEAKLDEIEKSSGMAAELAKLRQLVLLNESMKTQESEFKANCKRQLAELQAELERLKKSDAQDDELKRLAEIERTHAEMTAKHNRLRELLAQRNQAIADKSRLIDDIPTRTELIQYERRFVELYEQVAQKLDETRKYYNSYNTLTSRCEHLQGQVRRISAMVDTFAQAMSNKSTQEQYLTQVSKMIEGIKQVHAREQGALDEKQRAVAALESKFQSLREEQRAYFKAVKDFQVECDRNEMLSQEIAKREGGQQ